MPEASLFAGFAIKLFQEFRWLLVTICPPALKPLYHMDKQARYYAIFGRWKKKSFLTQ